MPVYHPGKPYSGRGTHLTNWYKAAESLGSITRLSQELNKIAWLLGYRVERSELNLSSQNISHKLDSIALLLETLPAQVEAAFANENLPDASAAKEAFVSVTLSEAEGLRPAEEPKRIRGKRFQACTRDGRVFLVYRKRGDMPNWIGFELDFSVNANSSSPPVYLNSQADAERFIDGD